jgi:hypothetical protein
MALRSTFFLSEKPRPGGSFPTGAPGVSAEQLRNSSGLAAIRQPSLTFVWDNLAARRRGKDLLLTSLLSMIPQPGRVRSRNDMRGHHSAARSCISRTLFPNLSDPKGLVWHPMEAKHEEDRYPRDRPFNREYRWTPSFRANYHSAKQRSRCSRLARKQVRSSRERGRTTQCQTRSEQCARIARQQIRARTSVTEPNATRPR